jgi:sulfide dehydrogenase [flavocytochrome c] flavoprotein subunit
MKNGGTYAIIHSQGALPLPARTLRARLPGRQLLQAEQAEIQGDHPRRQRGRRVEEGAVHQGLDDLYKDIVEYRPNSEVKDVDVASKTAILEFDKFKADVLNVIPPHRAGDIAAKSGIKLINDRWVDIDWLSMESTSTRGVHVLGDAVFPAPTMPKSGHMANQHGKLAAAAILNLLAGDQPNPTPVVMNTCYSFVDAKNAIHVTSVHQYDPATKVVQPVKGAGGVSAARNEIEGKVALGWAKNIWADMLA